VESDLAGRFAYAGGAVRMGPGSGGGMCLVRGGLKGSRFTLLKAGGGAKEGSGMWFWVGLRLLPHRPRIFQIALNRFEEVLQVDWLGEVAVGADFVEEIGDVVVVDGTEDQNSAAAGDFLDARE